MAKSTQRVLQLAGKYARAGQFGLAEQEYRSLLARFPANARARAGLARLGALRTSQPPPTDGDLNSVARLLQRGEARQADLAARDLLTRFPDAAPVNRLAGLAAAACGRPKDAVACYRRALDAQPDDADTLFNLGNALRDLGDAVGALDAYAGVIALRPDHVAAYTNIGVTLSGQGQPEAAIASFEQAVLLAPGDAGTLGNLGREFHAIGDFARAVTILARAWEHQPDCADTGLALGNACFHDGQLERAVGVLEAVLVLRPDFAAALNSLASAQRSLGQLDAARTLFEKLVRLRPDYCLAHYNLSTLKTYHPGDAQFETMAKLHATADLPDEAQMQLGFALAKAYEDLGDWDRSFACLETGNHLQRQALAYDLTRDNVLFQTIRAAFQSPVAPLIPGDNCAPLAGPVPVFILGMPRSGTTLCEQILASHTAVQGTGELAFLASAIKNSGWRAAPPDTLQLQKIRRQYLQGLDALADPDGNPDMRFATDKMPLNFRLVGFILAALPEARIIHVRRDARATCWSIYRHHFSERGTGTGFACDLVELATFYRMYLDLMGFWHDRFPGRILDFDYEALTENQERESRRLLAHVGLDWQAHCLDFQTTKRVIRTASATQVRQKMYRGSSEKWRRFEGHLRAMTDILDGY